MTKEPREAKQFATKAAAEDAAEAIGWFKRDVVSFEIMGFRLWGIATEHMSFLTPDGFESAMWLSDPARGAGG